MPEIYAVAHAPRPPRRFSVILPVLRPPAMLPHAIRSVLAQTEQDFELLVVCDGAPEETAACAHAFAERDTRIFVFPFPKGARHGEAHRHAVLQGARSEFVTYIGDDDLWFPDHLATIAQGLAKADFLSVSQVNILPDGTLHPAAFGDLRSRKFCQRMLTSNWNFFGPTEAGHRLSVYRDLAEPWAPGPEEMYSDLHMWRKFLRHPGIRLMTRHRATGLKFGTPLWQDQTLEERGAAVAAVAADLEDPAKLASYRAEAKRRVARCIKIGRFPYFLALDPDQFLPLLSTRLFDRI
jgi:glycosyltransferase involved in cell wall biosynthesis